MKKKSNSDKNFQPKGQESSKVDFILGDLVTHLGEQEIGVISGTLYSWIIWEILSWYTVKFRK